MLTRPIPRTTRIGVIGLLVISALGFVLLPMARSGDTGSNSSSFADRQSADGQAAPSDIRRGEGQPGARQGNRLREDDRRREGDKPRQGDRPQEGDRRRDGDRPREGEGREGVKLEKGAAIAGNTYYISTNGSDDNSGSVDSPFGTFDHAISVATPGDTIYVRGGTYMLDHRLLIDKAGTSESPINLWAMPGETPILDFSNNPRHANLPQPRTNDTVAATSNALGIYVANGGDWWHIKGLTVQNAAYYGVRVYGSNNIFERLVLHDNKASGLEITGKEGSTPSNNLVLNSDSYHNFDPQTNGEDADGFAAKFDTLGPGNVFRGCRAWSNSDDGIDFWNAASPVLVEDCWSFDNGFKRPEWVPYLTGTWRGDGMGFKLGASANQIALNRVAAWGNKAYGITDAGNRHPEGVIINNATLFNNAKAGNPIQIGLYDRMPHAVTNTIAFDVDGSGVTKFRGPVNDTFNTWNGIGVSASEFENLDMDVLFAAATAPRSQDGSLPEIGLRLAAGSHLIDAGTDVGLSYIGDAPDLGAFETGGDKGGSPAAREGREKRGSPVSQGEGREGTAQERERATRDRKPDEREPRPEESPEGRAQRQRDREGNRPPDGDRPRDADRPRDGDRPREGDRPRDGDRPRGGERRSKGEWRGSTNMTPGTGHILPRATEVDLILAQLVSSDLRQAAMLAMKKASAFYRGEVASYGGYVYYYSLDLQQRWGEGRAAPYTIFVQPPGTPTVGMAYLKAYAATGDSFYLDAAQEAAEALVLGQLESGGWTQKIHFARPERGRLGKYRKGAAGSWNVSSLDDGQTQAALQMLIRTDRALNFKHAEIHEAAVYGLDALLNAQFANGAFPQGFQGPVEPKLVLKARFPDYDWRTEGRIKTYYYCYTLNDNVAGTVCDALIDAHQVYGDERYKAVLEKLGDFLILAQMPDPQPGWCQQYNYETVPIWGRKFEPPAITGWESQDVMETLIKIARHTGNKKYLEPIPRALEYFKKCLLPDGSIARYYEFKTNRPLYMDARYQLTYDDSAVPRHYGWKHPARFESIESAYEDAKRGAAPAAVPSAAELGEKVRTIIQELDADGRWITTYAGERLVGQPEFPDSFHYISSDVFSRNIETLSRYIASSRKR